MEEKPGILQPSLANVEKSLCESAMADRFAVVLPFSRFECFERFERVSFICYCSVCD